MHTIYVSFMTRTKRSYLFHAKVAHLREPKTVLDSVSHAVIPGTRFQNLCRRNLDSWRGSFYMYLLSFARFWTLSIERFWFLFWNIWNGVTPKTSNSKTSVQNHLCPEMHAMAKMAKLAISAIFANACISGHISPEQFRPVSYCFCVTCDLTCGLWPVACDLTCGLYPVTWPVTRTLAPPLASVDMVAV